MKKVLESQEWVEIENNILTFGLSKVLKDGLGEIVHIKLPECGKKYKKKEEICLLESAKSAYDLYAPLSGKVVKINEKLNSDLSSLNNDSEKTGWLFKIEIADEKEIDTL